MASALVLPFLLVAALGVALVGWLLTRTRAPLTVPQHAAVMQVHRRSTRWFAWGVALALVVTVALFALAGVSLGRVAALAPAVGGMTLLLVMCVGELRSPRQTTLTRTAVARPRRVRDLVGAGPLALALATIAVAALTTTLVVGTAMGSPDDLGRAGRALTTVCGDATTVRGPWPGSYYAIPIAAALLVGLVAAAVTYRTIVVRPARGAEGADVDDALRRWSTRSVLLTVALVCWATLVPLLLLMTVAHSGGTCATSSTRALQLTFGAGALVSAMAAIGTFAALCTGPRLRPGQAPPGSSDRSPVGVPL
ncbi:hypothetical protein [Janibacter hoylei]|uniref:hypothetical protein n=1 Tax=Janibacter hoylei TaxID=364298 RepID=UPI0021A77354|nr:hypothetical protein [Janibacter hoylei]MCT1620064.1 hypothetical protein [Janibacter hoylei]MCT2293937.1 hypothetical protein [Janibacter hoylei]